MKSANINLSSGWSYNKETSTFKVSEKILPFDTTYNIKNPATGKEMIFEFSHSTGSEFDPKTRWVYKSKGGSITLEVCNDEEMTKANAENYLKAKTEQFCFNTALTYKMINIYKRWPDNKFVIGNERWKKEPKTYNRLQDAKARATRLITSVGKIYSKDNSI